MYKKSNLIQINELINLVTWSGWSVGLIFLIRRSSHKNLLLRPKYKICVFRHRCGIPFERIEYFGHKDWVPCPIVMALSNPQARFFIRIRLGSWVEPVPPERTKAEWRREAPMIYGNHYGPDNYMLFYSRPLLISYEKNETTVDDILPADQKPARQTHVTCSSWFYRSTRRYAKPSDSLLAKNGSWLVSPSSFFTVHPVS